MKHQVVYASSFKRSLRKLERLYPHVRGDVEEEIDELLKDPEKGDVIPGGRGVRKSRLLNTDVAKGKSGGYRLLYCVESLPVPTIYLLLLYAKGRQADVSGYGLRQLLRELQSDMGGEGK